jgi:integrase
MTSRISFSEARLRALPTPASGQRAVYYDTKQRGLQLRVTPNGVKTFSVFHRVRGGRPERVTIGRWPEVPLDSTAPINGVPAIEGARAIAARLVAQLETAENPAEARRRVRAELTLGELFEHYAAERERAGKRSIGDLRALWELYVGPLPVVPRKKHGRERAKPREGVDWSKRRLSEITTQQISALHARIVAAGKPTTANRVHELLRAMYSCATRQRIAADNPAIGVTQAKERDRSRFLGSDELPVFMAALSEEPQPWRDYFTVLLYVGYRRAAVAAMRWKDVDLQVGAWSVPNENSKNGDPIVLPLTGPALDVLRARWSERESSPWVFPGRSAAGHVTQPKKAWARLLKRAGVQDLRPHDLRRTLGSWLAMSGVSLLAIGRALGHKDPRSTQVYARLQADAVTHAVRTAHEAMQAAISNPKVIPFPVVRRA